MTNSTSIGGICCLMLSAVLQNKVSFSGSPVYTSSQGSYFSLQETAVHPICIVSPQTTQDVSVAVRALTTSNYTNKCQFAIRSGGHASFAGAANIQGGVTIDLSALNEISLEVQQGSQPQVSTVSVGAGSTWGSVYSYLDPLNLSVTGGRAASVGVGGLLLGGGISYFGPQFGWACDSVANLEVVLFNGSVINVNQTENTDLLWALRGGTNNFGIITRVSLQTFEQGNLWGGFVLHPYSTANKEITALAMFVNSDKYDEYASLITTFAYVAEENTSLVINNMEYTRPVANPPVFEALTSLPTLESTQRITNLSDLATETTMNDANGFRQASATLTISPTIAAINATVRAWESSLPSVRGIPGLVWAIGFDPLPSGLYARHAHANALGLGDRDGKPLLIAQLTMTWRDPADDNLIDVTSKDLIATAKRDVRALGALDPFLYVHYAAAWQDPFMGYGEASLEKLRRVRQKYDPKRVFTDLVPGGFKIPG